MKAIMFIAIIAGVITSCMTLFSKFLCMNYDDFRHNAIYEQKEFTEDNFPSIEAFQ